MKTGDVIVKFGGTPVTSPQQLQIAVERSVVGTAITVDIVRDGKPMELTYTGEATPNQSGVASAPKTNLGVKMQSLGIEISALTEDVAKQLGMENQTGVVVTRVQDSIAAA
jgi:serine protease Do